MNTLHRGLLFWLAAAALLSGPLPLRAQSPPDPTQAVAGEVLYKLRESAVASSAYQAGLASKGRTGLAAVDGELTRLDAAELSPVFDPTVNTARKHEAGMDRVFLARYAGALSPREAAARLGQLPEIEWAEPNGVTWGDVTPNDSFYQQQWAHHNRGQATKYNSPDTVGTWDCDGDTNQAWDVSTGAFSVLIAVLDTGIDRGHPEFSGKVLTGWDFVNNDSDPNDDHGHGTACAGIASARGNNGQGVAGVAWENSILPVKVLDSSNSGNNANLAAGIQYAADMGAKVISMSIGGGFSQTVLDAVNYAWGYDCVQVAASGNANLSSVDYPAAYDHVAAVGALSPCNERKSPTSCDGENWWGSNYSSALDFVAPGVRIHTTDIRGAAGFTASDYNSAFNGTSAATPFVAGVAALIRTANINLTGDQVYSILRESCDDIGAAGYDNETGWGRINAYVALRRVTGAVFVGPNAGAEFGTYYAPYNTVQEGITYVSANNFVVIKPGSFAESPLSIQISKVVHLDAIDGGVTVH